jgi:undecaprenyl-diphosphatase
MDRSLLYPLRGFGSAAAIIVICAALVYWELSVGVYLEEGFFIDQPIMLALHSLSRPWLDSFFLFITRTGDILLAIPVRAMVIYLWRRSERTTAALYLGSVITFPLISLWLKELFGRPRPEVFPPLVVEHTASFPSGHTLTAVAAYGLAAIFLWQRGHKALAILATAWLLLISLSRVYLGAHYPSDVLASLALGVILVIVVLYLDRQMSER